MLANIAIRRLYDLAMAEGEGVGTAYEYYVKRLILRRWLPAVFRPQSILIAGLPQKYGSSLDFFLLAAESGAALTVVDERPEALDKAARSLSTWVERGSRLAARLDPTWQAVEALDEFLARSPPFDLILSSEVLQALPAARQSAAAAAVTRRGCPAAFFCPNLDNQDHVRHSGLTGLSLDRLQELFPAALRSGFIDMPPFPPGMVRSDTQRAQAEHGRLEAVGMWGLQGMARLESVVPPSVRRRAAHIVYVCAGRPGPLGSRGLS